MRARPAPGPGRRRHRRRRRLTVCNPPHTPRSPPADVSKVSSQLVSDSKKFKWSAKKLNLMDQFKQWLPCAAVVLCLALVLLWKFYI